MNRIPVNESILFINQSSGYLMIDMINQFAHAGYKCDLVAGSVTERNRALDGGVRVWKVIQYNNRTIFKRLFTWVWCTLQVFIIVIFRFRKAHLFIVTNPPIAPFIALLLPNQYSLLVFDIYPEAIIELGILKEKSLPIKLWQNANSKIYNRAKNIFTLTEGMKESLLKYSPTTNVEVVHLWADNDSLIRIPRVSNPFIREHDLYDYFVVLYSGNIGVSNNVDILLEVARLTREVKIKYLIVGDGSRRKNLSERVNATGLDNLIMLPRQDVKAFPFVLSCADIGVVSLGRGVSRLSIPSKIYSLLSLGVPVMGVADRDSDLNKLIEEHAVGKCFLPEEYAEMANYIMDLSNNRKKCEEIRKNSLRASSLFTSSNAGLFVYKS